MAIKLQQTLEFYYSFLENSMLGSSVTSSPLAQYYAWELRFIREQKWMMRNFVIAGRRRAKKKQSKKEWGKRNIWQKTEVEKTRVRDMIKSILHRFTCTFLLSWLMGIFLVLPNVSSSLTTLHSTKTPSAALNTSSRASSSETTNPWYEKRIKYSFVFIARPKHEFMIND